MAVLQKNQTVRTMSGESVPSAPHVIPRGKAPLGSPGRLCDFVLHSRRLPRFARNDQLLAVANSPNGVSNRNAILRNGHSRSLHWYSVLLKFRPYGEDPVGLFRIGGVGAGGIHQEGVGVVQTVAQSHPVLFPGLAEIADGEALQRML